MHCKNHETVQTDRIRLTARLASVLECLVRTVRELYSVKYRTLGAVAILVYSVKIVRCSYSSEDCAMVTSSQELQGTWEFA